MASAPSVHQIYRRGDVIGRGAYGSVHKGVQIATGKVVALKIVNLDTPDDDIEDIQREIALLSQLKGENKNITAYHGCYLDGPRVWIVMDLATGGSVRTLMKPQPILEEKYVVVLVREVLVALSYLHKSGVIHRDLKAANVLVTREGNVSVCDFGVSAVLSASQSKRSTLIGTPHWMAPEVAAGSSYDTKADIWSLGITIFEMAAGNPPLWNQRPEQVVKMIPRLQPPRSTEIEGGKDMRDFVSACLKERAIDRLSADDLAKTKWIKVTARTPVTILRELVLRYDRWAQEGGTRDSIAGDLPWEEDEQRDLLDLRPTRDSKAWEFDTMRASHSRPSLDLDEDDDPTPPASTAPSRALPRSMRGLFDDGDSTPDPFRIGGASSPFVPPSSRNVTPTPPLPSGPPPMRHRGRAATLDPQSSDTAGDAQQTVRQAAFAFPPRTTSKPAQGDEPPSPSSATSPPIISPNSANTDTSGSNSSSSTVRVTTPSYKDVRTSRGVPDIAIPPADPPNTSLITSPPPVNGESPDPSIIRGLPRLQRPVGGGHADFRFPGPSPSSVPPPLPTGPSAASPIVPPSSVRTHNRLSPTHVSTGSVLVRPAVAPGVHQSTHSLDVAARKQQFLQPRPPATNGAVPPAMSRGLSDPASATLAETSTVQSAVASTSTTPGAGLLRKPSLNRQASVAVMEQIVPPVKPFAARGRDRSGSGASNHTTDGIAVPPLKDVLKLGPLPLPTDLTGPDLLPPSPSPLSANTRFNFTPAPSSLSRSVTPAFTEPHEPGDSATLPDGVAERGVPPPIQPLDIVGLLGSHEATHAQLARTVDELTTWLSVVEAGLTELLEPAGVAGEKAVGV